MFALEPDVAQRGDQQQTDHDTGPSCRPKTVDFNRLIEFERKAIEHRDDQQKNRSLDHMGARQTSQYSSLQVHKETGTNAGRDRPAL